MKRVKTWNRRHSCDKPTFTNHRTGVATHKRQTGCEIHTLFLYARAVMGSYPQHASDIPGPGVLMHQMGTCVMSKIAFSYHGQNPWVHSQRDRVAGALQVQMARLRSGLHTHRESQKMGCPTPHTVRAKRSAAAMLEKSIARPR